MTVSCPRCGTRYRLPPRSKLGANPTYRCVRCRHVFEANAAAEAPALGDEAAVEDDDDAFTFDVAPERGEVAEPDDTPVPAARVAEDRPPPVKSAARFAVRTVVGVTLLYALLSIYLHTHPETVRGVLGDLPIIGTSLAEKRLDPSSIQLVNVHGEYQRVKGDRLVFVISGTAINNAPVAVRGIQIEGRISATEEQHQVAFCGAAPRDVRDLSVREIALLQTLEPPKDWTVAPGEQTTFLVVFVGPPSNLREFAAEVVAVQGQARRRSQTNVASEAAAGTS